MARHGGWRRRGAKGRFKYVNARGKRITDPDRLGRIEELANPPAWRDVWISPRPRAKLQATSLDRAERKQYLYHPEFRARQEHEKFDRLIRFAERLPGLRKAMSEHMDGEPLSPDWVCALAVRFINLGWFRVGTERLREEHAHVRDHDAAQGPRARTGQPHLVPFPREAPRALPHGAG